MNQDLFKAILSMDSYNRGYNASIVFGDNPGENNYSVDVAGTQIGNATILKSKGDDPAKNIGFYASAYSYNGEVVISYRGTDDFKSAAATLVVSAA